MMPESTTLNSSPENNTFGLEPGGYCPHCSQPSLGSYVFHGGHCPKVKAVEYHPNGSVKRVEFHGEQCEPNGIIPFTLDAGIFNLVGLADAEA